MALIERAGLLKYARMVHEGDEKYPAIPVSRVNEALAVDAIEVVRCRDCRYADWEKDCGLYFCHASGDDWNEADFFCADGERRKYND